ncbi:MAG: hypothetical protein HQL15_08560 [Candidatus Omnitrophica bacterium]|nr:hypothetical protein [Candidatus Omnitrophota bacterium]
MNRKCPQTLDKPILLFGLEMEDVALLGAVGGVGSILLGPLIPGVLTIVGWILLMQFKRGKPTGYLIHVLYHQGVDFPGLIPPIKKAGRYSIYGTVTDLKKLTIS